MPLSHNTRPMPRLVAVVLQIQQTWQSLVAAARSHAAERRRLNLRRATCETLHQLDDRTLGDLGFDRSEIGSIALLDADCERRHRVG